MRLAPQGLHCNYHQFPNMSMAFHLSFASLSPKLSTNANTLIPSTRKHIFLRSYRTRTEVTSKSKYLRIRCIFLQRNSKECENHISIPTISYMPTMPSMVKRLENVIAVILIFIQISSPVPMGSLDILSIDPAKAVLYSPDTKVPRTGELALRKSIPANPNMKAIQDSLEDISYLLRIPQRKPFGTMEGNVKKALKIATDEKESILTSVPTDFKEKGSVLYASLIDRKVYLTN